MGLPTQIRSAVGQPATVRIGVVVTVSPLTVNVQTAVFTDVGVLGSYLPTVGDTVALLGQSPQSGSDPTSWLAMGNVQALPTPVVVEQQAGQNLISFSAQTSFTVAVVFAVPFSAMPSVHANIDNGTASAASWQSRAISVSTTGFTLFVYGPSSTWVNVIVQWSALLQTQ
jgi:hypothetical protein